MSTAGGFELPKPPTAEELAHPHGPPVDVRAGGHVVGVAPDVHACAPGWRDEQTEDGVWHAVLPTPWEYPKGTVWECDCGRRWISRGPLYLNEPGRVYWRREPLWSRVWRALSR